MDIRETSGATSPSMGGRDPFGDSKTATQHMAEIDEANMRIVSMIENFETDVVVPMLDQMAWNNQQFMSYPRVVRDIGAMGLKFQDRFTIRPEDVLGRFIVTPLASHRLTTKQTQVQQLTNILDRAPIINQMYGPTAVNMPRLLAHILEMGFDIRNVDDFISLPMEGKLMTPSQEHELWYHLKIPPRKPDDNDMRHYMSHVEEMSTERFQQLEKVSPGTASRARAHIAEHIRKIELVQMMQEQMLMHSAQQGSMQAAAGGGGPGGESPIAGAGGPEQDPESPKVRNNETDRGEGSEAKSSAGSRAPNAGAQ